MDDWLSVPLYRVAHGRAGDKGNRSNISVICWYPETYEVLVNTLTADVVRARFAHRKPTAVMRYLIPNLHAMNFVLDDVLDGGVNQSCNLDSHGKALSFYLLGLEIRIPSRFAHFLVGHETMI